MHINHSKNNEFVSITKGKNELISLDNYKGLYVINLKKKKTSDYIYSIFNIGQIILFVFTKFGFQILFNLN